MQVRYIKLQFKDKQYTLDSREINVVIIEINIVKFEVVMSTHEFSLQVRCIRIQFKRKYYPPNNIAINIVVRIYDVGYEVKVSIHGFSLQVRSIKLQFKGTYYAPNNKEIKFVAIGIFVIWFEVTSNSMAYIPPVASLIALLLGAY